VVVMKSFVFWDIMPYNWDYMTVYPRRQNSSDLFIFNFRDGYKESQNVPSPLC
jgi:hypothetical protein